MGRAFLPASLHRCLRFTLIIKLTKSRVHDSINRIGKSSDYIIPAPLLQNNYFAKKSERLFCFCKLTYLVSLTKKTNCIVKVGLGSAYSLYGVMSETKFRTEDFPRDCLFLQRGFPRYSSRHRSHDARDPRFHYFIFNSASGQVF